MELPWNLRIPWRIKKQLSSDGSLNTFKTAPGQTLTMGYDGLRRLSTVTGGVYGKTFNYRDISTSKTTTQVASIVYDLPTDLTYSYTYDANGNIATYAAPGRGKVTYTYDSQGQLTKATGDGTYNYSYDAAGNLLTANGHTYTYGDSSWKDLLTAYDGQSISYDASGNPTSYYNGTRWTFGWANGRQLTTATNGTTNISYTYDTSGLRTSKTVGGVKHSYTYAGGKLMRETYGSNTLDFFYDSTGNPYALKYNNTLYYYITNLQGDVTRIVNASGSVVASYEYDPYGNITSSSGDLAAVNPLRYRGYYYDSETGLYYVSSRYYDPEIGRWINADGIIAGVGGSIQGYNMFTYCFNNPVNMIDSAGTWPQWVEDLWKEITDFFDSETDSVSAEYQDGNNEGSGSLTAGYSEFSVGALGKEATHQKSGAVGIAGKLSLLNASGKIGTRQSNNMALYGSASGDLLVVSGDAGWQYQNGLGIFASAQASLASGTVAADFDIYGWNLVIGLTGDLGAIGAEAKIGIFDGVGVFKVKAAALVGGGFIIEIRPPQ